MNMDDLKPCPFCGKNNLEMKFWLPNMGQEFFIKCNYCQAFGPRYLMLQDGKAIQQAKDGWNERK